MKKFLKWFGICFLALILIITVWAVWYVQDEKLNPDIAAFVQEQPFDPHENFYVAWGGLHAPAGTKDTYNYGLRLYEGKVEWDDETVLQFNNQDLKFDCWARQKNEPSPEEKKPCANASEVQLIYHLNEEYIERYKTLYTYDNFTNKPLDTYGKGQDVISLHLFWQAYWPLLAKNGRGDEVIQAWIDDTLFLQKILKQPHTFVEHAIWMVTYGINLKSLPVILEQDPALLRRWNEALEDILRTDVATQEIWTNVVRGEYAFMDEAIDMTGKNILDDFTNKEGIDQEDAETLFSFVPYDPNATRNKIYEWGQAIIDLAGQPLQNFEENQKALNEKFREPLWIQYPALIVFDRNIIGNLLLGGVYKGSELVLNSHLNNANSHMLILYMRAKAQNIAAADMAEFLAEVDKTLYDPVTGKPFVWDEKKMSIHFAIPKGYQHDLYYDN